MSSYFLTVSYSHHRAKVPYKPSTLLKDVRDQACKTLGLSPDGFGLKHSQKQLDLTLPFRYANLVDNAHVDLAKLQASTGSIRVKVRIPGKPDFVGTFDASEDVAKVAAAAGVSELALGGQPVSGSLQTIATGSVLFMGRTAAPATPQLPVARAPAAAAPVAEPAPVSANAATPSTQKSSQTPAPVGRQIAVILPSSAAPTTADEDLELTESQFVTYHNYLRKQAGSRSMLSKSTKERLAQERRQELSHITVRVRLPDQTHLQAAFTNAELTDVVYDFVRSHLRDSLRDFYLASVESPAPIERGKSLIHDYKFGSRVLLVLKWTTASPASDKAPVLSDATLSLVAEPPKPAAAAAPARNLPPAAPERAESPAKTKSIPKWLKLHK